ncbi:complement component C8 beta chain-like [Salvelinus alpinus]|uniref:complement component C8 beta chain-like n=1 Tax=Salvelinus alpinus TaxID=8036 RepID=UPI0039FC9C7B
MLKPTVSPCYCPFCAALCWLLLWRRNRWMMMVLMTKEDTVKGSMVEDFVSVVRGGDSESITSLAAKKLPTPQLLRLWGEAVHYNPDFIRRATRLRYELVTSRDFSRAISLKKNLMRQLLPLC